MSRKSSGQRSLAGGLWSTGLQKSQTHCRDWNNNRKLKGKKRKWELAKGWQGGRGWDAWGGSEPTKNSPEDWAKGRVALWRQDLVIHAEEFRTQLEG